MAKFFLYGRWQYRQGQGHVVTCLGAEAVPVVGNVFEFKGDACDGMQVVPPADLSPALLVRETEFSFEISCPPFFGLTSVVSVMKPELRYGVPAGPRVNWSACGEQDEQAAVLAYIAALELGVRLAAKLAKTEEVA